MIHSNFAVLIIATLVAAATVSAAPALPQQAPDPAPAATATTNQSSEAAEAAATAAAIAKANAAAAAAAGGKSAAAKPNDDAAIAKKAKEFGWHSEVRQGVTVYCREAPVVGSRFTEKKCASGNQLAVVLEQQEFERDQLKQRGCGGNCGGK
jgi:hypothetical protein